MAARRRDEPPGAALAVFGARTKYGPMFACTSCMGTFFLEEVVVASQVPVLAALGGQARYLDRGFIAQNLHLFNQLDNQCTLEKSLNRRSREKPENNTW